MSGDFSPEQKRYLEGFLSGLQIARAGRGLGGGKAPAADKPTGPDASHIAAQDRVTAAGGKLNEQERWKREQHPFDAYQRLTEQAANNEFPKPADTFRWKYYGLFYVAPAQNSFMCRLRMPNGILTHWQLAGLADLAARYGGGYSPRHHPRQPANPRHRGQARRRHDRGDPGPRPGLARLRRRQHPQRHRHADRGHRPAGADRHAALRPRLALPHPQRPLALRPAAQVQRRLRRRRPDPGAGGHQRHRLPGGRGEGRLRRRAGRLVPARARRHHRPPRLRPRHRRRGHAGGRHQGGRRDRARVHRPWRPHQSQQGADEIRARCHGLREISGAGRGEAWQQARPRARRGGRAAAAVRPQRAYRRACAEAGRPALDRRGAAGRQAHRGADARACDDRAASLATAISG